MLLQRHHASRSHVVVVLCKPILAILLQRKHQTIIIMHLARMLLLCFVNPSLQYCNKENIRRSSCISLACCFCLLQRKHMVLCGAYGPMLFWFVQKDQFDYNPMRCDAYGPMRCDAVHMRCGAYAPMLFWFVQKRSVGLQTDAMMCIWSDAVHMLRCCSGLYKKDQFDYKPMLFWFVQKRSV